MIVPNIAVRAPAHCPPVPLPSAAAAAEQLRAHLRASHEIAADLHEGDRVALLSVWTGLVVWTNGSWFRWQTGRISDDTGRSIYAHAPADDPVTAAKRIARRYHTLRHMNLGGLRLPEVPND